MNGNVFDGLPPIKCGQGKMEETEFGARRESNEGRGRFDLLPYEAMEALAKWYEAGAVKYGDRNWENGISVKDCINRMIRHALKAGNGWTDEDHLAAVMWNAAAAITMRERRPDCDDHIWKEETVDEPLSWDITRSEVIARDVTVEEHEGGLLVGATIPDQVHDFMSKKFNIPPEVFNKQPDPPACYSERHCKKHIEHREELRKLQIQLDEIISKRMDNGELTWIEKCALRDVCTRLSWFNGVDGLPDDLQKMVDRELEALSHE